jgi:microcystin-dependent protein
MSDPYLAEIRIFAGNFAPKGWALCSGQLLSISQNTTLFSLLGTYYGGNGTSTFGLPNLQGNVPLSQGTDRSGNSYVLGETAGEQGVTLLSTEMAAHGHGPIIGFGGRGATPTPTPSAVGVPAVSSLPEYIPPQTPQGPLAPQSMTAVGSNQPHNNVMPTMALTYIICMSGTYPPRN